jgi:hypothetical protein
VLLPGFKKGISGIHVYSVTATLDTVVAYFDIHLKHVGNIRKSSEHSTICLGSYSNTIFTEYKSGVLALKNLPG